MPDGSNEFMQSLSAAIDRRARALQGERLSITTKLVHAFDAEALSAALLGLDPKDCDCAVVVATEDETVRRAIDQLSRSRHRRC